MKNKIRKYFSARLIEILWDILPNGKFKREFAKFIIENILVLVTIMSTTSNLISQQLTYLWSMLNKSYTDPSPAHMDNAYF